MARSARVVWTRAIETILSCCLIYTLVPFKGRGLALTRADKALGSDGPARALRRPGDGLARAWPGLGMAREWPGKAWEWPALAWPGLGQGDPTGRAAVDVEPEYTHPHEPCRWLCLGACDPPGAGLGTAWLGL